MSEQTPPTEPTPADEAPSIPEDSQIPADPQSVADPQSGEDPGTAAPSETPDAQATAEVPGTQGTPETQADQADPHTAENPGATDGAVTTDNPDSTNTADTAPSRETVPAPTPAPAPAVPTPASATPSSGAAASPAPAAPSAPASGTRFGRVAEDGTVYVRIGQEEHEVGSYPGATPDEALAYFGRKFDEVAALAELLYQRVTQTDLSAKEGTDGLTRLREAVADLRAVGDFAALYVRIEDIATALEVRRTTETQERAAARAQALESREAIVAEAEKIAAQPEAKIQWKASSTRMRALLDEWKAAQRSGTKLERDVEQALWHRLSAARNSFDKLRRVHFAQLSATQAEAKARKEELVARAEALQTSTEWGPTAGAFKRLMGEWREAGRASRADDDALWKRFKTAQDAFFAAKDNVVAEENQEFEANLVVKEALLKEAQAILPVTDVAAAKARLRPIQEKWDEAGKVPRAAIKRMEDGMRKVEQAIRDAEQHKWKRTDPEVAARAHSMVTQLESAVQSLREDLAKAEAGGDQKKISKAKEALEAREAWLAQARAGLEEFDG